MELKRQRERDRETIEEGLGTCWGESAWWAGGYLLLNTQQKRNEVKVSKDLTQPISYFNILFNKNIKLGLFIL